MKQEVSPEESDGELCVAQHVVAEVCRNQSWRMSQRISGGGGRGRDRERGVVSR